MGVCIPRGAVEQTGPWVRKGIHQLQLQAQEGGEVIHLPDGTLMGALGTWEDLSCRSSKEHLGFWLLEAVCCNRWAIDPT